MTHYPVTEDTFRTFVYFAQAVNGGPIKIGSTLYLREREKTLQTGSPVPIRIITAAYGTRRHEVHLHEYFHKHRLHGEWFAPCFELVAFVESLPKWHAEIDESTLPRFAYDQKELFNSLYQAGFKPADIARHFGFSRQRADQKITCKRRERRDPCPIPDKPIAEFISDLLDGDVSPLAVEYPA